MTRADTPSVRYWAIGIIAIALLTVLTVYTVSPPTDVTDEDFVTVDVELSPDPVDFESQVRPILERRCVVCHGCYDAPCQLKLSSPEGLRRGASSERVYNPTRLRAMDPTRLFVDADTTQEWRSRGFHTVINEEVGSPQENLANSVLYRLLLLKQQNPQPRTRELPDSITLGIDREEVCAAPDTVSDFARQHPLWGMPYAMPNLSPRDHETLVSWIAQGAAAPIAPAPSADVLPQIETWESFLNQTSKKERLVSRYLYEHLFHAHIHFAGSPSREFFRLTRSSTPPGQPVNEIPTVRPYDDPGSDSFYYRLLPYTPSIVAKNHIVYEFSEQRLERYRELFLTPEYAVSELPSYQPELASNPFKTFEAIPPTSRYRFLLDDARFFIEGFVKGPVCRGQIALNVIEDRFWVMFFDPDEAVFTNTAQFIGDIADDLQIPSGDRSDLNLLSVWTDYWQRQRRYMETKQSWFEDVATHDIEHALNYVWDGDGDNPNAALTVFRHFDSGSVAYGLVGTDPDSAWVIDYPLFERIHYLLVAGFNVFGNVVHQINTRIYMDFLRMEGEDHFLVFLPTDRRKQIRDSWYVGHRSGVIEGLFSAPQDWLNVESVQGYRSDDPQQELYGLIKARVADVAQYAQALNRCDTEECDEPDPIGPAQEVDRAMVRLSDLQGGRLHAFPDAAFVRVRMESSADDLAYTLIRDKAYKNVTSFLADQSERERADIERDRMTVVKWLEGSYPNFFFSVAESELDAFIDACAGIQNEEDFQRFVDRYGVRRTNPAFWALADWFQDEYARTHPVSWGVLDLSRYQRN